MIVEPMEAGDWERVAEIYAEGIATGNATFETEVPTREVFEERHLPGHRVVARDDDGRIIGWGALSRASVREVYRGVAECSVYVAGDARTGGVGGELLAALARGADEDGIWTLEAVVFPENEKSLHMLESGGFRRVGHRERFGRLDGRWRDVVLMERRGPVE